MQELPKTLQDEIEALEDLDARSLHRKYPAILKEAKGCSISSVLRGIVAYALQDGFYGCPLSKEAAARQTRSRRNTPAPSGTSLRRSSRSSSTRGSARFSVETT